MDPLHSNIIIYTKLIINIQVIMEKQSTKKKSLFSQRIKQAREFQNPMEFSFPKAVKINVQPQIDKAEEQLQKETGGKRFVDKLLGQALKQEQIEQMQRQNMNSISQMSEQEILKYQELIMKQISPALIEKLKKGKINAKKGESKPKNIKNGSVEVANEMIDECEEQNAREITASEKKQKPMNSITSEIGSLQKLVINIKTNKLEHIYFEVANQEQKNIAQQKISIRQLKLMLESQNNQTQIVASKILVKLCEQVVNACEHSRIIQISYDKYHALMLSQDIYDYLIKSLMFQIKKTHFKSCWLEMMSSLIKCCKLLELQLAFIQNGCKFKQISQFLAHQENKSQIYMDQVEEMHEQNSKMTVVNNLNKQQLQNIIKYYRELKIGEQNAKTQSMSGQKIIQQIMIQQLEEGNKRNTYKFKTLLEQIGQAIIRKQNIDRERCRKQNKMYTFYNMDKSVRQCIAHYLYPICLHIYSRQLKSNKLNPEVPVIKQVIWNWYLQIILCDIHSFMTMDMLEAYMKNEETEDIIYQYLFILRTLSQTAYHQLLLRSGTSQTQVQISNDRLANLLTLLNIKEYFHATSSIKGEERGKQIENVEKLIVFLTNNLSRNYLHEISSILFVDLMVIFTNYLEYKPGDNKTTQQQSKLSYQDINENILDSLYIQLVQVIQQSNSAERMWALISQENLKSLIQSYNYNSFGNYVFTKLIAFLVAACTNANTIEMIFDEVIARYPFLFYYAGEHGLYGPIEFYLKATQIAYMKNIYDMLNVAGKAKRDNMFVRYLLKI